MTVRQRGADPARAVDVSDDEQGGVADYEEKARAWVDANAAKNKASREEKKAKEAAEAAMVKAKKTAFAFMHDGVTFDANIAEGSKDSLDPVALARQLNDPWKVLELCSITKTAVEGAYGTAMVEKVKKTTTTPASLSIKKRK